MDNNLVTKSFEVTFILLVSISILTALRSFNHDLSSNTRLSLQLSTLVTIIASFHYYLMLNSTNNPVIYRYLDWFFTTPILLIDFCIIYNIKDVKFIIELLSYNTIMLIIGMLGELGFISMVNSMILGFVPFILLFSRLYKRINNTIYDSHNIINSNNKFKFLYIFIALWAMYGFIHIYPRKSTRDVFYNSLDLLTKGAFGIFIFYISWQ